MSRRSRSRRSTPRPRTRGREQMRQCAPLVPITTRLAEAGLWGAVFTVLAFRTLRFEGYEQEKFGLLLIYALLIVGANLARRFDWAEDLPPLDWRGLLRQPLVIAVLAYLVAVLAATLFSLDAARSLWGSPFRSQGLVTALICGILFWQAIHLRPDAPDRLASYLLIVALPVALLSLISRLKIDQMTTMAVDRPGSTGGNPNYISAWLVEALLVCLPLIAWRIAQLEKPIRGRRLGQVILWAAGGLAMLGGLALASSRGALLGLGTAILFGWVAWLAARRQRRPVIAVLGAVALLGIGYNAAVATIHVEADRRLGRLLQPVDEFRAGLWQDAAGLYGIQTQPIQGAGGYTDLYAGLRPLLGYGPDTIEWVHTRRENPPQVSVQTGNFVDRFHNVLFDIQATTGWLGLLAWLAINEAAFYSGLRGLGLLDARRWWAWLLVQAAGAMLGALLVPRLLGSIPAGALLPVSGALGLYAGNLAWVGGQAFRPDAALPFERRRLLILGILCALLARWIELQFGFMQLTSAPLWWILAGLLVNQLRADESAVVEPSPTGRNWLDGALLAGLIVLLGMGVGLASPLATQHVGSPGTLLALLGTLLAAGWLGAWSSADDSRRQRPDGLSLAGQVALVVGAWAAYFALKWLLRTWAAGLLPSSPAEASNPGGLMAAFALLGVSGALAAWVGLLAWLGRSDLRRLSLPVALIAGAALLFGSALYVVRFTPSALHRFGDTLARSGQTALYPLAEDAYQAAARQRPDDAVLQLDRLTLDINHAAVESDPDRRAQAIEDARAVHDALLERHPLLVNLDQWQRIEAAYRTLVPE